MQLSHGELTIYGRSCPVVHSDLVLIPPSVGCNSFSLCLHADAFGTGGGYLMLDYLAVDKVTGLDSLHGACICFRGDDPDGDDTVGSDPVDLATSVWTFPVTKRITQRFGISSRFVLTLSV